jgi:hypothetical protein
VGLEPGDHASPLELADGDVVERHVVRRLAVQHQAVVVDGLCASRGGEVLDGGADARVERVDQDHLRAVREALVGLRSLPVLIALGVDDAVGNLRSLEGLGQIRAVE